MIQYLMVLSWLQRLARNDFQRELSFYIPALFSELPGTFATGDRNEHLF